MLGYKHTEEALAKLSEANSGANNPMYGKVPVNAFESGANNPMYGRTGELNPMYGQVPANAMTINVYSPDGKLIKSFSSQVAAAEWLNTSRRTLSRYIKSGKVWNNLYRFEKSGYK